MERVIVFDELIKKMIAVLDKEEEGASYTTYELLNKVGETDEHVKELLKSKSISSEDLMALDFKLMQEAGKYGYYLDNSSHNGRVEGLPYNLDFVVRRRVKKKIVGIEIKTHCVGLMKFEPDLIYNTELYITNNGNVQYKELSYEADENGCIDFEEDKLLRQETVTIDKETTNKIFTRFIDFLDADEEYMMAHDAGEYEIIIHYSNGTYLTMEGSLIEPVEFENMRFNMFLDELIDIEDMTVLSWNTAKVDHENELDSYEW